MKQRIRIKLLQRRRPPARSGLERVAGESRYKTRDHRRRFDAIYAEHKELFKRLEDA
jgi:hypothetical protein